MLPAMPFGMAFGDLVLIVVIVVVVFGATKLPLTGNRTEGARTSRWTRADWTLLAAAILSVSVAVALEIWKARHH
jgi:hypothetical protein